MNSAIESRSRLNRMIDEVLTVNNADENQVSNTHLRKFFIYQEELARMVKLNILLGSESPPSDVWTSAFYRGSSLQCKPKEELESLFKSIAGFFVVSKYKNELVLYLSN